MLAWITIALLGCGDRTVPTTIYEVHSEPVMTYPKTTVYAPEGRKPWAGVVLLHGSEGGKAPYTPALAEQLARRGVVTAAFCWYDCDSPAIPDKLVSVPLDRTVDFLHWFRKGPAHDLPVVLYGASRGAEQAVLLGSLVANDKLFEGIAAHAPSDTVVASYDRSTNAPVIALDGFETAWTWRGFPQYGERELPLGSGPRIAIEAYPGALWLSHGEKDPLWPATRSQRLADARKSRPDLETELHIWPGEGHVVQSQVNQKAFVESLLTFVFEQTRD